MSSATAERIAVEVAYARPDVQLIIALELEPGATVAEAIARSGVLARFPEIDLARAKLGVFGKPCGLDTPLRGGDRVEIYRPLLADPKEVRRQRAARDRSRPAGRG